MYVVAIAELATSIDDEAGPLALDLGVTAYEVRLNLAAGLPAVVLMTPDKERALALLEKIRARRHVAIACDAEAVVASDDMVSMRRFQLTDDAVLAGDVQEASGGPQGRLDYADVLALLRATHRRTTETRKEVKERKLAPGAAIASGGLIMTKTVKREIHTKVEERESVLYIFRRSGATPWLLRETETQYVGLGPALGPTRNENFATTIRLLRERAPGATYDDRLMTAKKLPSSPGKIGTDPATCGADLLAHLLAMWIARATGR